MTTYLPHLHLNPSPYLPLTSPTPPSRMEHSCPRSSIRPPEAGAYQLPAHLAPRFTSTASRSRLRVDCRPRPTSSSTTSPARPDLHPTPLTYLPVDFLPLLVSRLPKPPPTDTMYDVIQVTPVTRIQSYTSGSRDVCSIRVFPSNSPKCMLHTLQISLSPSRREGDRHIDIGGNMAPVTLDNCYLSVTATSCVSLPR